MDLGKQHDAIEKKKHGSQNLIHPETPARPGFPGIHPLLALKQFTTFNANYLRAPIFLLL